MVAGVPDASINFTAVVLAGGLGSRMRTVPKHIPKAMLPVAGRPMIWYSLSVLEQAGFSDIIVLIQEEDTSLATYLHEVYEAKSHIVVETITEDDSTTDCLRQVTKMIKNDFVVLSSDLISDLNFRHILDTHILNDATLTMTLSKLPQCELSIPFEKRDKSLTEVVARDVETSRIVYFTNEADLDDASFKLSRTTIKKYPNLSYRLDLLDCHLYVFKRWVLDFLLENKHVESIKADLVPLLVRKQFKISKGDVHDKTNIYHYAPKTPDEQWLDSTINDMAISNKKGNNSSSSNDYVYSGIQFKHKLDAVFGSDQIDTSDKIRCFSYVVDNAEHSAGLGLGLGLDLGSGMQNPSKLTIRANTIPRYYEANFKAAINEKLVPKELRVRTNDIHSKSQIGKDTMIGKDCKFGERCSIKKSIIGDHCHIANNVKIQNSILMGHVSIDSQCHIVNTIVCNNSLIQQGCDIRSCVVGHSATVDSGTQARDKSLTSGAMNGVDSAGDSLMTFN